MPENLPTWEITLNVYGPITVERKFNFRQRKDFHFNDKLYSDIEVSKNSSLGITITLTAYAIEQTIARKAALYFCGQALDVLSLNINLPTILTITDNKNFPAKVETERRRLAENELSDAFKTARLWVLTEPTFLRAVGWYRKGLYTEDPFDKFLAFFNSIEILCNKYNPNKDRCNNPGTNTKCHMWETFKSIWGECPHWPIIPNEIDWIDENYDIRKDIAHGIASIDVNVVENVTSKIETIKSVAYKLISDWKDDRLAPRITDDISEKLF
ncbi:methylamine utilization protein MauJ [Chryseobacterium paludis]|uniref:methylamine utilization protein MauJ n=1 Tax=Chryseobacterium paludis TaxID=2956784 RepID=UPI0021C079F0|nr:methylamine utilization protein MauJ [Chryseobacterium paludis]